MTSARLVTEFAVQGPRRGADRAVLLAHGAGADMHAPQLTTVADALADAGIPSLRFQFPYRAVGRRAPDRPPVLAAAVREAAATLVRRVHVPPGRIVLGGRSMGGRVCSLAVAGADGPDVALPALGLVLLGYPLHPPGRPERLRIEHFGDLRVPVLFVHGTRDPFGTPAELRRYARRIKGPRRYHWVETGDHAGKPLRASGRTFDEVLAGVAAAVVDWVVGLE